MKVTVVPAQITTVEDRIAGNLGLNQLVLLCLPIFGGSLFYVVMPPTFHGAIYKYVIIGLIAIVSSSLAIRIRGKIVLLWLIVLARYGLRPRYYLFNKSSLHGREEYLNSKPVQDEQKTEVVSKPVRGPLTLSVTEALEAQSLLNDPAANASFIRDKKGGLYVHITEVQQEG